jgi:FkbM family methyltransferase
MTVVQAAKIALLRPYISRELPGWGKLYDLFVGDYRVDEQWKGGGRRWVRGKLHGYEMSLDLGYWSNRQTFFLKRFYDLPTQLFLLQSLRAGDTFIDVGANEGMISILAARLVSANGRVIAFEPNPKPRTIFQANVSKNSISNITIEPVALGRSDADMTLHVPAINTGEGSFAAPEYSRNDLTTLQVPVANGDGRLATETPSIIKIDVEGFELEVLRGLEATLQRCKPVVITEIVPDHLHRLNTSPAAVSQFMKSLGYSPRRLGLSGKTLNLSREWPDAAGDYVWQA